MEYLGRRIDALYMFRAKGSVCASVMEEGACAGGGICHHICIGGGSIHPAQGTAVNAQVGNGLHQFISQRITAYTSSGIQGNAGFQSGQIGQHIMGTAAKTLFYSFYCYKISRCGISTDKLYRIGHPVTGCNDSFSHDIVVFMLCRYSRTNGCDPSPLVWKPPPYRLSCQYSWVWLCLRDIAECLPLRPTGWPWPH